MIACIQAFSQGYNANGVTLRVSIIMKKLALRLSVLILSCVAIFSLMQKSAQDTLQLDQGLITAFEYSGAKGLSSEIYFRAMLDNEAWTMENIREFMYEIGHYLDMSNISFDEDKILTDIMQKYQINFSIDAGSMANIMGYVINKEGRISERHITVSITSDYCENTLREMNKRLMKAFDDRKVKPHVNMAVTGYYEGKLNESTMNRICANVFDSAGAYRVQGIKENNLISLSAYSPGIKNHIEVNGNKVNMNLAIRYNSYENRTYIWIGVPVLSADY